MGRFVPDDGGAAAMFVVGEVEVLTDLLRVMVALLDEPGVAAASAPERGAGATSADSLAAMVGIDNDAQRPDHPALARLLPDGYRDDDAAAGDFRRFTQADLRAKKLADARSVRADLTAALDDPLAPPGGAVVRLDAAQSRTWMRALNDVRLALGASLGVTEDDDELDPDDRDPASAMRQIYAWLTDVQGTLIETMEPRSS